MKTTFTILACLVSYSLFGQYPNVRVSHPNSTSPEEVTIAINPINPEQIAAGANIKFMYYSNNGGLSWTEKTLSSSLGVWGDPCVIYDGLGNLYFAHLSNPINGYWIDRIVVQKSTDNGLTWSDGAGIGYQYPKNQDKEWMAVDLSDSPYKNNLYISWTEFDNYGSANQADSSRILFARSTDQGVTWSQPVRVSDVGGNCIDEDNTVEGAVPAVGPNGEVYVSWAGPLGLLFDKSTDGGITFGEDIFVSDMPGGWDFSVPGIYRCNGLPVTACDTSFASTRGNIYVMWGDQRNGSDNSDVWLIKSTDGGNTWGERKKVNSDNTTRHQFFPWVSIDQTTGCLYFIFYDRRSTTGSVTDVYVARSTDGGETFENFKVSQSSFTPNSGVFFGDYANIAAFDRKIYPIWMRMDGTALSIWSSIIQDTANVPVELSSFIVEAISGEVVLHWETATEMNNLGFEIERKFNDDVSSKWTSAGFVKGNSTTTKVNKYTFKDKPSTDGKYSYRLKQVDFAGTFTYSNEAEVYFSSQKSFVLFQNYPNPFNPSTTISYQMPYQDYVSLKVFDVLGNEVADILHEIKPAGLHEIDFDGSKYVSGIYIYKMMIGGNAQTKRMIFLK